MPSPSPSTLVGEDEEVREEKERETPRSEIIQEHESQNDLSSKTFDTNIKEEEEQGVRYEGDKKKPDEQQETTKETHKAYEDLKTECLALKTMNMNITERDGEKDEEDEVLPKEKEKQNIQQESETSQNSDNQGLDVLNTMMADMTINTEDGGKKQEAPFIQLRREDETDSGVLKHIEQATTNLERRSLARLKRITKEAKNIIKEERHLMQRIRDLTKRERQLKHDEKKFWFKDIAKSKETFEEKGRKNRNEIVQDGTETTEARMERNSPRHKGTEKLMASYEKSEVINKSETSNKGNKVNDEKGLVQSDCEWETQSEETLFDEESYSEGISKNGEILNIEITKDKEIPNEVVSRITLEGEVLKDDASEKEYTADIICKGGSTTTHEEKTEDSTETICEENFPKTRYEMTLDTEMHTYFSTDECKATNPNYPGANYLNNNERDEENGKEQMTEDSIHSYNQGMDNENCSTGNSSNEEDQTANYTGMDDDSAEEACGWNTDQEKQMIDYPVNIHEGCIRTRDEGNNETPSREEGLTTEPRAENDQKTPSEDDLERENTEDRLYKEGLKAEHKAGTFEDIDETMNKENFQKTKNETGTDTEVHTYRYPSFEESIVTNLGCSNQEQNEDDDVDKSPSVNEHQTEDSKHKYSHRLDNENLSDEESQAVNCPGTEVVTGEEACGSCSGQAYEMGDYLGGFSENISESYTRPCYEGYVETISLQERFKEEPRANEETFSEDNSEKKHNEGVPYEEGSKTKHEARTFEDVAEEGSKTKHEARTFEDVAKTNDEEISPKTKYETTTDTGTHINFSAEESNATNFYCPKVNQEHNQEHDDKNTRGNEHHQRDDSKEIYSQGWDNSTGTDEDTGDGACGTNNGQEEVVDYPCKFLENVQEAYSKTWNEGNNETQSLEGGLEEGPRAETDEEALSEDTVNSFYEDYSTVKLEARTPEDINETTDDENLPNTKHETVTYTEVHTYLSTKGRKIDNLSCSNEEHDLDVDDKSTIRNEHQTENSIHKFSQEMDNENCNNRNLSDEESHLVICTGTEEDTSDGACECSGDQEKEMADNPSGFSENIHESYTRPCYEGNVETMSLEERLEEEPRADEETFSGDDSEKENTVGAAYEKGSRTKHEAGTLEDAAETINEENFSKTIYETATPTEVHTYLFTEESKESNLNCPKNNECNADGNAKSGSRNNHQMEDSKYGHDEGTNIEICSNKNLSNEDGHSITDTGIEDNMCEDCDSNRDLEKVVNYSNEFTESIQEGYKGPSDKGNVETHCSEELDRNSEVSGDESDFDVCVTGCAEEIKNHTNESGNDVEEIKNDGDEWNSDDERTEDQDRSDDEYVSSREYDEGDSTESENADDTDDESTTDNTDGDITGGTKDSENTSDFNTNMFKCKRTGGKEGKATFFTLSSNVHRAISHK